MVAVTVTGSGGQSVPVSASVPPPEALSLAVSVANTDGDWMFALVTWRQVLAGDAVTVNVGDDAHNWWEPLGVTTSLSGTVRSTIWYAPMAKAASTVMVSPTGRYAAMAATILDVNGLTFPSLTGKRTAFANSASSLASMTPAPGSPALIFTTLGVDSIALAATQGGSGWTSLPLVSTTNGTDTTGDLQLNSQWQVASSATSSWSVGGVADLAGNTGGTFTVVAAPAQASPNWPVTVTEIAPGSGPGTPPDQMTWVTLTPRALSATATQGRQYNLAALAPGAGVLELDNPDGAVMPPGTGSFAGIDSGTPYRIRQTWTGGAWQLQWSGNGSTGAPQADTGNIFPVTAGQPYAIAAWLACSAPYASGIDISIRFKNGGGTLVGSATSPLVTGTVPQLVTASGTAPAGATQAAVIIGANATPATTFTFFAAAAPAGGSQNLVIPPGISWGADNSATVTTLAAWTADVRGAPVVSPFAVPFSGYLQKWPRQWDQDVLRGVTAATTTDAFGYCNGKPLPILMQEILNEPSLTHYWPLTDPAGSAQASNLAPGSQTPLVVATSKYGTGGATQAFGANASALLGAQGTLPLSSSVRSASQSGMWQQTLPSNVTTSPNWGQGYTLTALDSAFPPLSGGVTLECWFQVIAPFQGPVTFTGIAPFTLDAIASVLMIAFGGAAAISGSGSLSTPNLLQFGIASGSGPGTGPAIFPPGVVGTLVPGVSGVNYQAMTALQQLVLVLDRNTWQVWLNGSLNASGSFASALPSTWSRIFFNGDAGIFAQSIAGASQLADGSVTYSGYTAHAAVFSSKLTPERIQTHYIAGQAGMAGDFVRYRLERLLQGGTALSLRRVLLPDTGQGVTRVASCQDIAGQPVSTSLSNIAGATPPAVLAVTRGNELFYLSRSAAWNQPVRWVIGDAPWLGEIPFRPGISLSYDPLRVVDDVQLTQLDSLNVITPSGAVNALEPGAQAQYGDQSYWQTGYLQGDLTVPLTFGPSLVDQANWVAGTNATPVLRLDAVLVEAASHPAAWQFVMQACPGDMVQVNIRPATSTEVISITGRISQVSPSLSFSQQNMTGSVAVLIDAAPEANVLTADDPVRGQLTGAYPMAW